MARDGGRYLLAGLVCWLLVGCGGGGSGTDGSKLQVVCTTGMVADLVRQVGGDGVQVTTLMREGVDPHLYKPTPSDITALSRADLIFYSGRNLEGKMGEVLGRMARMKPTCAVADAIPTDRLLDGDEGHHDPHLWFDVALWSQGLKPVQEELARKLPRQAATFEANAEKYRQELLELDGWARKELAQIPKQRRVLVTAHDAFRYFGRAYEVEVRGIQGISTESEAGLSTVNELVAFLKQRQVPAVFVESSVSEKNVRALIEGCASPPMPLTLKVGGELYSDAMGAEGTPEGTYEGMVRHNVRTIVEALR